MRHEHRALVLVLALLNVFALAAGVSVAATVPARMEVAAPHLVERDPVSAPSVLEPVAVRAAGTALGPAGPNGTAPSGGRAAEVAQELRTALEEGLRHPGLGSSVSAMVVDPTSERVVAREGADVAAVPASTAKLLTAAAALKVLGPDARLATSVVGGGERGVITLVGGGDPTLVGAEAAKAYPRPAKLPTLAERAARALRQTGTTKVRLGYDDSLFTGPSTAPGWEPGYIPAGYVGPVTALSVNAGRVAPGSDTRVPDPARAAAEAFADLLEKRGITVGGVGEQEVSPGAKRLATVHSPPVSALVEQMLVTSDNDLAEALGHHVAMAVGKPASFRGATAAVERVLTRLGVPMDGVTLHDCSGLSHQNRVTARALTRVLALAVSPQHPQLRSIVTGLPVAGYSGTLTGRYSGEPASRAAGLVRGKTGTLSGVSTLAGVAYRPDGRMLVFAFLADGVPVGAYVGARQALDRMAATLVSTAAERESR